MRSFRYYWEYNMCMQKMETGNISNIIEVSAQPLKSEQQIQYIFLKN